jgi:hypothetical protein
VGTSYKAVLEEGTTVVVKRLKDVAVARREFDAHMEALGRVEHRNLLPVRAYYFSKDEKLLVYDYLPNGSLSAMLHGTSSPSPPFFFRWFFSCYAAAVVHTEIVAVAVALAALLVQFQPVASLLGFALVEFAVLRCQPSSGSSNLGRIPKFTPTSR